MSRKLISGLSLGAIFSVAYLSVFFAAVQQQQTSYIALTQAHSPQMLINTASEEVKTKIRKAAVSSAASARHD